MSIIYQPTDTIANGRYEIIRLIGEGGAGVVYHCRDKSALKELAVKILRPELVEDKKQVEIFQYEAELAIRLHHPNIIATYDVGGEKWQESQVYYLVMEYLTGGTLTRQLKLQQSIPQAIAWMKQLLNALGYAHKQGVVHQDIKSANVLLAGDGQVKIGDFGSARSTTIPHLNTSKSFSSATKANSRPQKRGTPAYMSPELCFGELQDERSDIYSLGVLFFEILTGQVPFEAQGIIELARQHISKPVPSISRLNSKVPSDLDNIIKRMMAKNKDDRFQSTHQVLDAIEAMGI